MRNIALFLALLTAGVAGLSFVNDRKEVYLLPNVETNIAPFGLVGSSQDNFSEYLFLQMDCSPELDTFIQTGSGLINFCNGLKFRGKISDVEAYFSRLVVTPKGIPQSQQSVTYRLRNSGGKDLHSLKQLFNFPTVLTLKFTDNVFKFNPTENGRSQLMATVDLTPFEDAGVNPDLELQLLTPPAYLHSFFTGSSLYLKIDTELRSIQMGGLKYTILERKTGMKTPEQSFNVETTDAVPDPDLPTPSDQDKPAGSKPGFLRFLFLFIVAGGLFYFFCVYRKAAAPPQDPVRIAVTPRTFQREETGHSDSFEIKQDVLTDSVISWNKDLMAKKASGRARGQEGAELVSQEDLGADHSEINPEYTGGVFGRGLDEISVISRDPRTGRGGVDNHSAFLDGLNI